MLMFSFYSANLTVKKCHIKSFIMRENFTHSATVVFFIGTVILFRHPFKISGFVCVRGVLFTCMFTNYFLFFVVLYNSKSSLSNVLSEHIFTKNVES